MSDTLQIILTFSLLFTCARGRFLYFIICMVINAKCMPQRHFLSILLPGRSEQQVQLREKCKGSCSPSWLIWNAWAYCFDTTSSHAAKSNLNLIETLWPCNRSLKAQYLANVILSMSVLLLLTHQALVPLVLFCFVFPQYVPVPTSKFSHSSFFAVSSEFYLHSWWHVHAFASFLNLLFPVSFFSLKWYFLLFPNKVVQYSCPTFL